MSKLNEHISELSIIGEEFPDFTPGDSNTRVGDEHWEEFTTPTLSLALNSLMKKLTVFHLDNPF